MKPVAIAGRYARALAELVGETDAAALEAMSAEIGIVGRILAAEAAFVSFFDSPTVRQAQKDQAIATIAERARLSDLARRFLAVVVAKHRTAAWPAIAAAFAGIRDAAAGIVPVEATVAKRMSEKESEEFRSALETLTGRKVRLSFEVDPEILGGVVTRIGSRVYDGTLRSQLKALHRRLAAAR